MLKQTVQFLNIDNVLVSRDLYFNITRTELNEQNALSDGQFEQDLRSIGQTEKMSVAYPIIQRVIGLGYGVRTEDGDFYKSTTDWERFKGSLAYNQLMEDVLFADPGNNGTLLANFVKGMMPPDLQAQIDEQRATAGFRPGVDPNQRPTPPAAMGELTGVQDTPVAAPVPQDVPVQPAQTIIQQPIVQDTPVTPNENPVQQIATPRTDLIGGS